MKFFSKVKFGKSRDIYSPFIGSGAFEFYLIERGLVDALFLSDSNQELICTYNEVRNNYFQIMEQLKCWLYDKDLEKTYYTIRDSDLQFGTWYTASRFLFFRLTSYGGVYRTNRNGKYNVPFNKGLLGKDIKEVGDNFFRKIKYLNEVLNKVYVETYNLDYDEFLTKFKDVEGSFFYLDPPYVKLNSSSFISYGKNQFEIEDHKKLASLCRELKSEFVLSNSYCKETLDIYKDVGKIYSFDASQKLYKSQGGSGIVKEVIVTNLDMNKEGNSTVAS